MVFGSHPHDLDNLRRSLWGREADAESRKFVKLAAQLEDDDDQKSCAFVEVVSSPPGRKAETDVDEGVAQLEGVDELFESLGLLVVVRDHHHQVEEDVVNGELAFHDGHGLGEEGFFRPEAEAEGGFGKAELLDVVQLHVEGLRVRLAKEVVGVVQVEVVLSAHDVLLDGGRGNCQGVDVVGLQMF